MLGFNRITFEPQIMGGKACIRGMRITVSLILNLVADGMSVDEIIDAYPYVEPEDVQESLRYAAWLAWIPTVSEPLTSPPASVGISPSL